MRNFRKSDKDAIIILLVVIIICMAALPLLKSSEDKEKFPNKTEYANKPRQYTRKQPYYKVPEKQYELFYFDPNTADSTQLLRLGLQPWQVRNIYKYRAAGGIYHKPSDFARLYGLTLKKYRQLEPYIRISEDYQPAARFISKDDAMEVRDTLRYPVKLQPQERIVLNMSDTAQLRKVPGIGHYFARKIVEYRERLGGYVRVQQLLEIEDFPDTAVNYFIIPDDTRLRKLNLNRLSLNELKRHPYINFYQARAIVDYRRLHGPLESLQQLSLSRDFPPEAIKRLAPYVEF